MPRVLLVLLAATVGCGRGEPVRPPLGGPRAGDQLVVQDEAPPAYQDRTLNEWVEQAQSPEPASRQEAVQALAQLGPPGHAKLLEVAQQHREPETRLLALQAIELPVLLEHERESVPVLIRMTQDPDHLMRQAAALRLAWFDRTNDNRLQAGYQLAERLRALERAANDPNRYVRETARASLHAVQAASKGTIAKD